MNDFRDNKRRVDELKYVTALYPLNQFIILMFLGIIQILCGITIGFDRNYITLYQIILILKNHKSKIILKKSDKMHRKIHYQQNVNHANAKKLLNYLCVSK